MVLAINVIGVYNKSMQITASSSLYHRGRWNARLFERCEKMSKANERVRRAARAADIPLYVVAAAIGVSEATLGRWMRVPLSAEKEQRIMAAIAELAKEAV